MKTEKSKYDEQADKFLADNAIKFRATLSDSKTPTWKKDGEKSGHHFRVTLSRAKPIYRIYEEIADNPNPIYRIVFDFWGSIKDAEEGVESVTAYDVLACISCDSNCPETFKEFCSEFGDGEDSIRALQLFRRCNAFGKRLRAFFTPAELEQLAEIR